ncbi:MAG: hypothetical protein R3F60_25840 [bacterium]
MLKLDLRLRHPALRDRPLGLRVAACDDATLRFTDAGDPTQVLVAPRARYDRLFAERSYLVTRFPALFARPFADATRAP